MTIENLKLKSRSKRILTFDLLRGIFLIVIIINHVELYPSGLDYLTGRGRLYVSAAEGFFFMSGLLVGLTYMRRRLFSVTTILKKAWSRSLQLYLLSVFLTMFFTFWAFSTNNLSIKDNLPTDIDWWYTLKQTLQLKFTYGWADFLSHFAVFMFFAPLVFWMLTKKLWWLVILLSVLVWFRRGESFTAAWQILFFGGMVAGFHWQELKAKYYSFDNQTRKLANYAAFSITTVTFIISYASAFILSKLNDQIDMLPEALKHFTYQWNDFNGYVWQYFEKWTMEPGRIILFMFWFWTLFLIIKKFENRIDEKSRGTIKLLGQNSLFVYIVHSIVVFGIRIIVPGSTTIIENLIYTISALILIFYITRLYANKIKGKPLIKIGNFSFSI